MGILGIILLPVLVFVSGLCSASETAFFSLTHADRLRMRRAHPGAFHAVAILLAQPRSLLVAILLLNVAANTAYFTLAGLAGSDFFADAPAWAASFSVGCVLLLILLGEVLPKALASVHRVPVCRVMALPVLAWFRLITPLRVVLDTIIIAPLARLFRPAGKGEPQRLTPQDLSNLLDVGGAQGVLQADEQQLLADVVQLGTLRVKDIMCPRVDVSWLNATDTTQELLVVARDTGWTRYPICRGALNERQVVGLVNVQRVLPELARHGANARIPLASLVEPVRFVPERARVDQLLEHFRTTHSDAALVVSEHGELVGLVQIDDVIGELVKFASAGGEDAGAQVRMVAPGAWEVPGRLSVRDWEEFFEPRTEDRRARTHVSTVAGLILARLGRVPKEGDKVTISNLVLRVEAMRGRTIERVLVRLADQTGRDEVPA